MLTVKVLAQFVESFTVVQPRAACISYTSFWFVGSNMDRKQYVW